MAIGRCLPQSRRLLIRRMPPRNLDAYEAFLKGRYLTHQRFVVMGEARDCFQRAIALDPTFAPAYAALSENYGLCALYAALPPTEAFLAMRRFAEEAKARAPELAEPTICSRASRCGSNGTSPRAIATSEGRLRSNRITQER